MVTCIGCLFGVGHVVLQCLLHQLPALPCAKRGEDRQGVPRALEGSVAWWLSRRTVYLDERRLRGGDFLDPELAANICSSACMVLLFSPYYFDMQSMYCAREYKAMLELEAKRLKLLPQGFGKRKGLIIPVVMRGEQYLCDDPLNPGSTCPSATPNAWPKPVPSPRSAPAATPTTTRWPRRSSACTRPN